MLYTLPPLTVTFVPSGAPGHEEAGTEPYVGGVCAETREEKKDNERRTFRRLGLLVEIVVAAMSFGDNDRLVKEN